MRDLRNTSAMKMSTLTYTCTYIDLLSRFKIGQGWAKGAMPPHIFGIYSYFVLWEAVSQKNSVFRLELNILAPQNFLEPPKFLCWIRYCLRLHAASAEHKRNKNVNANIHMYIAGFALQIQNRQSFEPGINRIRNISWLCVYWFSYYVFCLPMTPVASWWPLYTMNHMQKDWVRVVWLD